jgi:tRNA 2-thiouridine synthesizing protein A
MRVLDNRGLQPPQPMMNTLEALEELEKGEKLAIINDRRPMFLFAELDEQGSTYEVEQLEDGSFKIIITK